MKNLTGFSVVSNYIKGSDPFVNSKVWRKISIFLSYVETNMFWCKYTCVPAYQIYHFYHNLKSKFLWKCAEIHLYFLSAHKTCFHDLNKAWFFSLQIVPLNAIMHWHEYFILSRTFHIQQGRLGASGYFPGEFSETGKTGETIETEHRLSIAQW